MIINKTLEVSINELDGFIKAMVKQDIENTTGKKVKQEDISRGYKYTKKIPNKMGKDTSTTTKIRELSTGKYEAVFETTQGINMISYTYHALDDNRIELVYEETFDADSKAKDINFKAMSFLYKRSSNKKANLMLAKIENHIIENRGQ